MGPIQGEIRYQESSDWAQRGIVDPRKELSTADEMQRGIALKMKNALILLLSLGGAGAFAASALRCDLTMQHSSADASCIDPTSINGSTVVVPSNVTRIGQDGLALCGQKSSSNLATDIEYIIDNSASMSSSVFWVDPATGDTSFYIMDCLGSVSGTKVPLRRRHFGGTGLATLGWDTLVQVPSTSTKPSSTSSSNCKESNDPYSMRAAVVSTAMQYQASLDSTAQAGMIQFNSAVKQDASMRALAGTGLNRLLDSAGLYTAASGTKWAGPLTTAFAHLSASPNAQKAIIMVSDGEPSDDYSTVIAQAGFPKVFGIFLGSSVVSVPEMATLTSTTGGKYWIVPPDRPDSLESVIRTIVGSVMSVSTPASTKLTNTTNGQSSKALSILQAADSTYHLQLDSVIALKSGKNSMQLISTWTDEKGVVNSDTSKFVLDVSGPAAILKDTTAVSGDTVFATVCSNPSTLQILDPTKVEVPYLTEAMGGFTFLLTPSTTATLLKNTVSLTEWAKGDKEVATVLTKQAGTNSYLGSMTLAVPRAWANTAGRLDANDGIDTLQATWCYPRDARDCAEDTIQIRSYVSPWVKWDVESSTGPVVSLGVKADLPGTPVGTSVTATYTLRGRTLVKRTMRKQADSLYHDILNVRQGGLVTGADTIWISKPGLIDSIVVSVTWTPKDSVISDTTRILRPSLVLDLQNLGDDSAYIGLSKGAQPNTSGKWIVKLFVGTRTATATLDSLFGQASVTGLLGGSSGPTATVRGLFVDPVYGDSVWDSISVPVPAQSLRFVQGSASGPRGSFDLVAKVPWESATKIKVFVVHGIDSTPVYLVRSADGSYLGSVAFAQTRFPGIDTLGMGLPGVPGGSDSLQAVLPSDGVHIALEDQAYVLRPALVLDIARLGRDSATIALSVGAQADLRGKWSVNLTVEDESSTAVLDTRSGAASVNVLLSKALLNPTWLVGRFVDPLYGDTVTDSVQIPVPQRTLQFAVRSVEGPRGQLTVVAYDPWATGSSYPISLIHGQDTIPVVLTRGLAGDFSAVIPFTQARLAGGDTLALGAPARLGATDTVLALMPGDGVHPSLRDTARILRPALGLVLKVDSLKPQLVHLTLAGGTPDLRGKAAVSLTKPLASSVAMEGAGKYKWNGSTDLSGLPESLDSLTVSGFFADPLYGDTVWASVRMAAPWFPGSIVAAPDSLDPRKGDSTVVAVKDRDPDTSKVDTVTVTNGVQVWSFVETGKSTGVYRKTLPARELDSSWATHAPRKAWSVILKYQDPLHDKDISYDTVRLVFDVPAPQIAVRTPITEVKTGPVPVGTLERSNGAQGVALEVLSDTVINAGVSVPQSISIRLWEKASVAIYVYDQIGVSVTSWQGEVVPKNAEVGALGLIRWDGRDQTGRPVNAGVYVVRVVVYKPEGGLVSNDLVRVGLK